ncbi:Protein phosphatase 1D [Mactra antiquata]
MSSYRIGMNLRVTEDSNQGGRRYMEDRHAIRFVKNDEGGFEFAYFGIFDGHGGGEASKYARDYLLDEITKYDCFWSDNDDDILFAIKSAFLDTHFGMWKEVDKWPRTASGLPSTAGTTASICIIKNSKLYIGHVGDSAIALGCNDSKTDKIVRPKARFLTKEHKPDDPDELKRIENSGGQVVAKSGVQRVVWNRPRTDHRGPIRRSTQIDRIPFLAVARSLGDLWSYNYLNEKFVVSPEPDVSVHKLDPTTDKCLVIGSDGLWNMLSADEAVNNVFDLECQFEYKVINDPTVPLSYWINPAERLVQSALNKWRMRLMKADNTSAIVVLIDPLGPRKLSILRKKREERMREIAQKRSLDNKTVTDLLSAKESMNKSPKKGQPKVSSSEAKVNKALNALNNSPHVPGYSHKHSDKSIHSVKNSSDNLDDSIQIRNAHLASPVVLSKKSETKLSKSAPCSPRTKTSPLQTSSSENLCSRTGMATRSSPQKSPEALKLHEPISSVSSNKIIHQTRSHDSCKQDSISNLSQKCLQPSKNTAENVRNTSPDLKVRDLENIYSSDIKLSLRNMNLRNAQKSKVGRNVNSNASSEQSRSSKKSTTKSLSTRISLRLRRLRQKTQNRKTKSLSENKEVTSKTGIKRKMDSTSGTPASKKLRHS